MMTKFYTFLFYTNIFFAVSFPENIWLIVYLRYYFFTTTNASLSYSCFYILYKLSKLAESFHLNELFKFAPFKMKCSLFVFKKSKNTE
jgi:hypothetical protein